jgi:hypothetical protein
MTDTTVLLTPFEALRIASGHPMRVATAGGGEVLARLATPDEILAANARGLTWHRERGLRCPPPMTRAEAERLTTPIGGPT